MFEYLTDGNEIYRQSFALIRAEADLGAFTPDQAQVAVRMIHAAGQTDLARDIEFSPHLVAAARTALAAGKPILTDVFMVHSGITRTRLPHNNEALCFLRDDRVPGLAKQLGTTRTAAAVELWEISNVVKKESSICLYYLIDFFNDNKDAAKKSVWIKLYHPPAIKTWKGDGSSTYTKLSHIVNSGLKRSIHRG